MVRSRWNLNSSRRHRFATYDGTPSKIEEEDSFPIANIEKNLHLIRWFMAETGE